MTKAKELIDRLSSSRQDLWHKFELLQWFKNTDTSLKKALFSLPEDFDGFLTELTNKPDELDNIDLLRLIRLERGNYLIVPVFEVRSQETNQIFTYEYVSWKVGSYPGYKGILLVEENGHISHFITKTITKFSQNTEVYDSFGGFIEFKDRHLINLSTAQEKEIKRQLGLDDLIIKEFIDLGHLTPDIGMTNNRSSLFAAIIDGSEAKNLDLSAPLKTKGISFKIAIHPISELPHFLSKIEDSYFLSAVSRLIALGRLPLNLTSTT